MVEVIAVEPGPPGTRSTICAAEKRAGGAHPFASRATASRHKHIAWFATIVIEAA